MNISHGQCIGKVHDVALFGIAKKEKRLRVEGPRYL